jgi:4-amino-4-deoxy-L-arabinose transferase-like glycosyltransferase
MALVYLAGTITPWGVLVTFGLLLAFLAGIEFRVLRSFNAERGVPSSELTQDSTLRVQTPDSALRVKTSFIVGLLLLIAVAAFLRIWGNQYSDLQGDEAEVLFRAARLVTGADGPASLLTHSKGPAEILIVAAFGALTGRMDEFTVRLPFALASVGGVLGVALLGWQWLRPAHPHLEGFGSLAGLVAGGLLAIQGVLVTYARTAQYQSLMFLFSVWAAWFFFDYYRQGRSHSLFLGTFLLSAAFLTHFEAILLAPLPVFLLWLRFNRGGWRTHWPVLAAAAGLAGLIVGAFYLPVAFNPQLRETGSYLAGRVGSAPPYNNFPLLYMSTLTYNAYYYLLLWVGLFGLGLVLAYKRAWSRSAALLAVTWLAAVGVAFILSLWLLVALPAFLLAISLFILVTLSLSDRLPGEVRGIVVWGGPAWLVYLFLVERPGNHYYVFFPAAALLAGWGIQQAYGWLLVSASLVKQFLRWTLTLLVPAGFVICTYYQYLLVVRNDVEYILTYPENRHPFFVTDARFPFGSRIGFGFPYRLGWQMVGHLYRSGGLAGDWGGNDRGNTPDWYTLGAARTDCYPRNVILGEITYTEDYSPLPFDLERSGYRLRYRIWDHDRLRMQVYTLDPLGRPGVPRDVVEPAWYPTRVTAERLAASTAAWSRDFSRTTLNPPARFSLSEGARAQLASVFDPRLAQVRDSLELVEYQVDETWSQPEGAVLVTLYWQAVESVHLPFKIFVHLVGEQATSSRGLEGALQGDDYPACGTLQMPRWQVGQLVADRHLVRLPPDVPSGVYRLEVGIYEPQTGLLMDKLDVLGNPAGNSLHLTDVAIH